MMMKRRSLLTLTMAVLSAAVYARPIAVHDLLNVNEVRPSFGSPQVQISPDGRRLVYQLRRTLLEDNRYAFDLWLVATDGSSAPRRLVEGEPTRRSVQWLTPRWSPDGRTIAYFAVGPNGSQISLLNPDDGEPEQLTQTDELRAGFDERILGTVSEFKWSPDGAAIALTAGAPGDDDEDEPLRGIERDVSWSPRWGKASATRLCTVALADRKLSCLTDDSRSVHSFDWSPDSGALAFAASQGAGWDGYMRTDLYVLDRATGDERRLVEQDGPDHTPVWSPDGRWIAFNSQAGRLDWQQDTQLAVVSAAGGTVTYPAAQFKQEWSATPREVRFSPDSSQIYFEAPYGMTHRLVRVPRRGGETVQVTPDDDRYYTQFSFTADGRTVALTVESVTEPPEVYVGSLEPLELRRITDLNPQLADVERPSFRTLAWRSADDRWDVHGALVEPPGFEAGRAYPLLVLVEGGPSMVRMRYDLGPHYPVQAFAARGYLVLAPNTRGRPGYGLDFDRAIRDSKDFGPGPLSDVLAGVDRLIAEGLADPDRLGIMGFSYGSYLTAYAVTQTDRFRGASMNDGPTDIPNLNFHAAGEPLRARLLRDLMGWESPLDRVEHAEMMRQSPLHNAAGTTTPTLLEYGERSHAPTSGRIFFQALRSLGVPAELIVYPRTGHGVQEPKLREDSMRRNLEWIDHWVRGETSERLLEKWGPAPEGR